MNHTRKITFPDRLKFELLILAEAARLRHQADLLGNLDQEVLHLASVAFSDVREFVRWLTTPTKRLDGVTPLSALASAEGRQAVVLWLENAANGGFI